MGHCLFLVSQLMMSVVILDLARRSTSTLRSFGGVVIALGWVGWVSKMLGSVQTVIDIVVGAVSRDHDQMDDMYGRISSVPGVEPIVYSVGPVVFFVVLVVLSIVFALQVREWRSASAVVLLLATLVLGGQLDLLPLTSAVLTAAFCSMWSARTRSVLPPVEETRGLVERR